MTKHVHHSNEWSFLIGALLSPLKPITCRSLDIPIIINWWNLLVFVCFYGCHGLYFIMVNFIFWLFWNKLKEHIYQPLCWFLNWNVYLFSNLEFQNLLDLVELWRSVLYSHVENTYMTASFHSEGRFGSIKLCLTPPLFIEVPVPSQEICGKHLHDRIIWSACTKPGKWMLYICVLGYRFCYFIGFFPTVTMFLFQKLYCILASFSKFLLPKHIVILIFHFISIPTLQKCIYKQRKKQF